MLRNFLFYQNQTQREIASLMKMENGVEFGELINRVANLCKGAD